MLHVIALLIVAQATAATGVTGAGISQVVDLSSIRIPVAPFKSYSDAKIRFLISGMRLSPYHSIDQLDMRNSEYFHEDGTHTRAGVTNRAHWSVEQSSVCVSYERKGKACRKILIDKVGNIFIGQINSTAFVKYEPIKIEMGVR